MKIEAKEKRQEGEDDGMEDTQREGAKEEQKEDGGAWEREEDACLRDLVASQGNVDWNSVAAKLSHVFPRRPRTGEECKERWKVHLDPALPKLSWTEQDDLEMLLAHHKYQNKWSDVASALNSRSGNTIKNKVYSVFRKIKNKVKKKETTYSSRIELLEILYIIALMHHYFAHPMPACEAKYKRGKDFIYTLLQGLCLEDVQSFQVEFARQWPDATPLDQLWEELAAPLRTKLSILFTPSPLPCPSSSPSPSPSSFPLPLPSPSPSPTVPIRQEQLLVMPLHNGKYQLPEPKAVAHPGTVTPEEKDFIMTQTFQRIGPCSAGSQVYQPMVMSPRQCSEPPFSAGRPQFSHFSSPQVRYGNFSDFSDVATRGPAPGYTIPRPRAQQSAIAQPIPYPPQSYSLFSPARLGVAPFPTESYSLFAPRPIPAYYPTEPL